MPGVRKRMLAAREEYAKKDGGRSRTILSRIHWWGLVALVWRSSPLLLRPICFPYGLVVYARLLAVSDSLMLLRTLHSEKYRSSMAFRLLRPRYHKVRRILVARLGIENGDETPV